MKPAFPIHPHFLDPHCTPQELDKATGMTLRDYFAAAALQGELSNPSSNGNPLQFARDSYRYADAMMLERVKQ